MAGVGSLKQHNSRIAAQPPIELIGSDIDCDNPLCTALQKALCEPSSRGADVQASLTAGVDLEEIERPFKLQPGTAHVFARSSEQPQRCFRAHLRAAVFNLLLVHKDLAGKNQSLRFLASVREPSFDQQAIQPELCRFHGIELNDGGIAALSA